MSQVLWKVRVVVQSAAKQTAQEGVKEVGRKHSKSLIIIGFSIYEFPNLIRSAIK